LLGTSPCRAVRHEQRRTCTCLAVTIQIDVCARVAAHNEERLIRHDTHLDTGAG
jgi:hypothetical protein